MNILQVIEDSIALMKGEMEGKALTRPALYYGDGIGTTYAIDVVIFGNLYLKNVPIAVAAKEVHYADVNSAVTLRRNEAIGKLEVVGFAKSVPGTFRRFSVDTTTYANGTLIDYGYVTRAFTYYELQLYGGGYGIIPYGSYGVFQGTTLIRIGI